MTHGDPIRLVCQFEVPERDEQSDNVKRSLEEQMRLEAEESARIEQEREAEENQRQAELVAARRTKVGRVGSLLRQEEEIAAKQGQKLR